MAVHIKLTLRFPEDISRCLGAEDVANKAKEVLVMQLLREHKISQGKAAFLLGVTRWELFDLMAKYEISVIDLTPEELEKELRTVRSIPKDRDQG